MDYTSDKLDLSDFTIYRDLSKPVGALNDTRYYILPSSSLLLNIFTSPSLIL